MPGGFGGRGFEGKILAAGYARENKVPYLGICYGLHAAVIDFAALRQLDGAHTTEVDEHAASGDCLNHRVDRSHRSGRTQITERRLGGTMRLGEQACVLNQGSLAERVYGSGVVHERHRHRYEVNIHYVAADPKRFVVGGRSEDGELVEMIELEDHPWFLACQFHPEFTSSLGAGTSVHWVYRGWLGGRCCGKPVTAV